MFSHVMIGTNDLEKAKSFYDALLGTLGVPATNGIFPSALNRAGQIAGQASPDNTSSLAVLTAADGVAGHARALLKSA